MSKPEAASPVAEVEPQVADAPVASVAESPAAKDARAGVAAAALVARPESPRVAATEPAPAAVASTRDPAASGSGGLPLPALILGGLFLLYLGARVVLGPVELDLFRFSRYRLARRTFPRA